MNTNIQFIRMQTSKTTEDYVIEKLDKFYKKYRRIIRTDVFFKKEKNQKGKGKICAIEINQSGSKIYAQSNEENFELAFKNTLNDVERQLKKSQ